MYRWQRLGRKSWIWKWICEIWKTKPQKTLRPTNRLWSRSRQKRDCWLDKRNCSLKNSNSLLEKWTLREKRPREMNKRGESWRMSWTAPKRWRSNWSRKSKELHTSQQKQAEQERTIESLRAKIQQIAAMTKGIAKLTDESETWVGELMDDDLWPIFFYFPLCFILFHWCILSISTAMGDGTLGTMWHLAGGLGHSGCVIGISRTELFFLSSSYISRLLISVTYLPRDGANSNSFAPHLRNLLGYPIMSTTPTMNYKNRHGNRPVLIVDERWTVWTMNTPTTISLLLK